MGVGVAEMEEGILKTDKEKGAMKIGWSQRKTLDTE